MRHRIYLLVVLVLVFAFNYADRFALGLVLGDIKADLSLSDTQLGFLSGIAFAFCYAAMGIPLARWADRGNRVNIISLAMIAWGAAVAGCGMVGSFGQLLVCRVGAGVGEAGCNPASQSLISDYYSRPERPRAFSIYLQGNTLSVIIGYFFAGWLAQHYGWRWMFVILAVPGVLLGIVVRRTLKEPRELLVEASFEDRSASKDSQSRIAGTMTFLFKSASFRQLLLGFSVLSLFNNGLLSWQPAFFVRSYGLSVDEVGAWFASIYGISTLAGMFFGGEWASRLAPNNEQMQLRIMAVLNAAFSGVVWGMIYICRDYRMALLLLALGNFGGTLICGPLFATLQTLVPSHLRATALAVIGLVSNLVGVGLGPLGVGVLSDWSQPFFGQESLRYALMAFCPGFIWVSLHLWAASKTISADVRKTQSHEEPETAEGSSVFHVAP